MIEKYRIEKNGHNSYKIYELQYDEYDRGSYLFASQQIAESEAEALSKYFEAESARDQAEWEY